MCNYANGGIQKYIHIKTRPELFLPYFVPLGIEHHPTDISINPVILNTMSLLFKQDVQIPFQHKYSQFKVFHLLMF